MTPFRTERLDNGITVDFVDLSNRYFGDYHRVCVEVRVTVPLPSDSAGPELNAAACLQRTRHLERMGVAGADVDAVRNRLAEDYWQHAGGYLARIDYPARLAASEAPDPRRFR